MRLGPLGLAGRSVPSHPSCTKEGVRQVKRPLLAAHQRLVQLAHVTNSKVSASQPSPGDVTRPHAFPSLVFHFVTFEREKSLAARSAALRFVLGITLTCAYYPFFFRQRLSSQAQCTSGTTKESREGGRGGKRIRKRLRWRVEWGRVGGY